MQGCHFKYTSIRTVVSRPVFALIHPHTLIVHSTRGIQLVRLRLQQHVPSTFEAASQQMQAQKLATDAQPGIWLATGTLQDPEQGQAGAPGNEQQCDAGSASSPAHRQQEAQASIAGPTQPQQQACYHQEPLEPDQANTSVNNCTVDGSNMHASTSGLQTTIPAKPSHSVWSMSASSEGFSADSHDMEQSPSSISNHSSAHAAESDIRSSLHEHDVGSEGMSYFAVCAKKAHANAEADALCGVTAEMLAAAFDPEQFIMKHVPSSMLQNHRLTDYAVEFVGNGDVSCVGMSGCADLRRAVQDLPTVQQAPRQQSVLLLIVAVLKPRFLWEDTERSTVIVANVNSESGARRLAAPCFLV